MGLDVISPDKAPPAKKEYNLIKGKRYSQDTNVISVAGASNPSSRLKDTQIVFMWTKKWNSAVIVKRLLTGLRT